MEKVEKDTWYDIPGFEGYYQLSDTGFLRRVRPTYDCGLEEVRRLETHSNVKGGSARVMALSTPKASRSYNVASLFYDTLFPDRAGGKYLMKDGDFSNLRKDNFQHVEGKYRRMSTESIDKDEVVWGMRDKGLSIKEIANRFGVTEEAVRIRCRRVKYYTATKKKWRTRELFQQGLSPSQIADKTGFKLSTVYNHLKDYVHKHNIA